LPLLLILVSSISFAQIGVEAYKLSETTNDITIQVKVKNNYNGDIQIENFPEYAREGMATYIYFLTTEERIDMSGKVYSKVFPFIFTPKKYQNKEDNYNRILYPINKGESACVDYILNKKKFNNDRKIIVYGNILYRSKNNKNKKTQ
ncbi:MAG: hypothetical protein Q4G63_13085, partial [Bacteroidia bacterium]|nr:hypothetical protein [Bacteroidia bacterium]